ncbi:MAG: Hpt domain-containing protein [Gemmatimonadota bacterium]|nr:MAG: Hpt domain-containing protein [Gemmatimonadota bacterium]
MNRTLLDFFGDEAREYLERIRRSLAGEGAPDADGIRRYARALRGSARMADQDAIARAAAAVQALASDLESGRRHWGAELGESLSWALGVIGEMVESVAAPADHARRAEQIAQRLGETVAPPPPPKDDDRFRLYLGTELRGLASDIGESLVVLERDPRNREPLKRLLRRIRPLRGIEGVDELPAVGAAVAAVEEVILRIADTSATVGPGHLVLFRRARQALDDVATGLIRGQPPGPGVAGIEIENLKERVLETAAQHDITWISELFHDDPGPHIEVCPMAERGAGSWDAFFRLEATGSLDTIDRLRADLARDPNGASRVGQRLAYTFRQLRERAVTFGHAELGRVARRAGAAVRASLEAPAWRLQNLAVDLAVTVAALRSYLETVERESRGKALLRAEESLHAATLPAKETAVPIESLLYAPDEALARARRLSSEASGILIQPRPDIGRAQDLLEEALGLIEHALAQAGSDK